jgi:hypothetical protein
LVDLGYTNALDWLQLGRRSPALSFSLERETLRDVALGTTRP